MVGSLADGGWLIVEATLAASRGLHSIGCYPIWVSDFKFIGVGDFKPPVPFGYDYRRIDAMAGPQR